MSQQEHTNGARALPVRKILAGVAIVLVLLIVAAGVAFAVYLQRLDDALQTNYDPAVQDALEVVPTDFGEDIEVTERTAADPFYVLLLGSDSREGNSTSSKADEQGDNQRSDVMMLARIDLPARQVTLVTIPRDTPSRAADGTLMKINENYNREGAAGAVRAVSELTGVPISHYVSVHFSELQDMIDTLGGVTVDVPTELTYKDALTGETVVVPAGKQTLTGQQAQIFARARHEFSGYQDMNRQGNVRTLLTAMLDKIMGLPATQLPGTVLELAGFVGTDLRSNDLLDMVWTLVSKGAGAGAGSGTSAGTGSSTSTTASATASAASAANDGKFTIYSCTGPYEGELNEEAGVWLCYEAPDIWAELMVAVDSGADPSSITVTRPAAEEPTEEAAAEE